MSIEVGEKVNGKVTGITNFGAFVDIGNHQTGLVHISQISDSYVKDIHDVLSVGDEVTVKVLSIKDGKIGLSIRAAQDKPAQQHHHSSHGPSNHSFHGNNHGGNNSHSSSNHHSNGGSYDHRGGNNHGHGGAHHNNKGGKEDFDQLLSGFLKESDERLAVIKHNTEGKRGGRGGRRS
ncbi:hypothetical protein IV38_GL001709 [Lactobacillus selangorensis]|uniref:S1 motif domain-containing protein n=1 Tax=Lactobacillus selangorensis TaxID=81857 RepID=A0A0R2FHY9_9LACO|nr:S1 domain-containing RNA-binding protein [Lactobacillus selangorensis]KRN27870.1 hypothetical protein IV38_GL001709 [Lactobacillus selangorensis]KRN30659.1 hypothetical protein IV40_GL001846 [Lactobacillus selangorensis]